MLLVKTWNSYEDLLFSILCSKRLVSSTTSPVEAICTGSWLSRRRPTFIVYVKLYLKCGRRKECNGCKSCLSVVPACCIRLVHVMTGLYRSLLYSPFHDFSFYHLHISHIQLPHHFPHWPSLYLMHATSIPFSSHYPHWFCSLQQYFTLLLY